jgi:hypothetical protein
VVRHLQPGITAPGPQTLCERCLHCQDGPWCYSKEYVVSNYKPKLVLICAQALQLYLFPRLAVEASLLKSKQQCSGRIRPTVKSPKASCLHLRILTVEAARLAKNNALLYLKRLARDVSKPRRSYIFEGGYKSRLPERAKNGTKRTRLGGTVDQQPAKCTRRCQTPAYLRAVIRHGPASVQRGLGKYGGDFCWPGLSRGSPSLQPVKDD